MGWEDGRGLHYTVAAHLCVNVLSTLGAICCDKDKILTLEGRKCSVSRKNDGAYGARDSEGDGPLRKKGGWGDIFHSRRKRNTGNTSSL